MFGVGADQYSILCRRADAVDFRRLQPTARCPSDQTVRDALVAMLPEMKPLEQRINAGLSAELPRWLTKRPQRLAVDLTLIPYRGEPFLDLQEIYRSQPKSGTTHFHAYDSCCVVEHGQRFTLAMRWVAKDESLKETG